MEYNHNKGCAVNPLKREKKSKREQLLKAGVDPYPHNYRKEHNTADVHKKYDALSPGESADDRLICAGRVTRKRDMGKAAFFDIQDQSGRLQCYIKKQDFSNRVQGAEAADLLMKKNPVNPESSPENKPLKPETGLKTKSSGLKDTDLKKAEKGISPEGRPQPLSEMKARPHSWNIWKLTDIGDIVGVSGRPFHTKKGELSLRVKELKILCKTLEPLPEKYHGLEDKELKCRFRHLDLIMDKNSREVFKTRSQIIREIRSFMGDKGFMEVETPVLQPIYGGAQAVPFETHFRRLNQKMYLKISPEIYLKKLIVGGFEKVYEIGKNFRNEGLDRTHNPEFTMMEYYEAYTDYEYQMEQFENLICHVVQKIKGGLIFDYLEKELDFSKPWRRVTLKEAVLKHGGLDADQTETWDLAEKIENLDKKSETILSFKDFVRRRIRAFTSKDSGSGTDRQPLSFSENKPLREWKAPLSLWLKRTDGGFLNNKSSLLQNENSKAESSLRRKQNPAFQKGEEQFFETFLKSPDESAEGELNELRDKMIMELFELTAEKTFWNPVFVTDFPLAVSPLTKSHRREKSPLDTAEGGGKKYFRTVERFEPYIAGMEMGNAYTELNDPVRQRERLERQKRLSVATEKQKHSSALSRPGGGLKSGAREKVAPHPLDENFLHALETGLPPTGGVGLGIERLVMILTNQAHLRDCILFPFLREKTEGK